MFAIRKNGILHILEFCVYCRTFNFMKCLTKYTTREMKELQVQVYIDSDFMMNSQLHLSKV